MDRTTTRRTLMIGALTAALLLAGPTLVLAQGDAMQDDPDAMGSGDGMEDNDSMMEDDGMMDGGGQSTPGFEVVLVVGALAAVAAVVAVVRRR